MAMNRSLHPKELIPGLNAIAGLAYKEYSPQFTPFFQMDSSSRAYEEEVMVAGLGSAVTTQEGEATSFDRGGEVYTSRYLMQTTRLGFALTEEAFEDNLYGNLASRYTKFLMKSMRHAKEVRGASIFNNGFDTAYAGGDGKPLFSATHPLWGGGTFSNLMSTSTDMSEASIEAAIIMIDGFVDERGLPVRAQAKMIGGPKELAFDAARILDSPYRPQTADNDINVINKMSMVPQGFAKNIYFTDPDAWFILTDVDDGLKYFKRTNLKTRGWVDDETGNLKYSARERFAFGWTDPRCCVGSAG